MVLCFVQLILHVGAWIVDESPLFCSAEIQYTAVWIWLRLTLTMCVLELVYSQPLALRKNVHQPWPLALNSKNGKIIIKTYPVTVSNGHKNLPGGPTTHPPTSS